MKAKLSELLFDYEGVWKVNSENDLELTVRKTNDFIKKKKVTFQASIISAEANSFVFSVQSPDKDNFAHFRIIKLSGNWQVNEQNEVCFKIAQDNSSGTLVFAGSWQLNKNQQIEYKYENSRKAASTFKFYGFWQLNEKNRLRYILSLSSNYYFDFRAQVESPNLYPKEGQIKYRLGAGVKSSGRRDKIVSLFGIWKFSRELGLFFEMEYEKGRFHRLEFGGEFDFNKKDQVSCSLLTKTGENLGINLVFTHKFIAENNCFVQLKAMKEECFLSAGIRLPF